MSQAHMSQHVECHRCGYGWDYTGNSEYYASCPKCKTSVPLVEDEDATTASAQQSATEASNERVDELRGRVKELEETASQLQSAIEEMTKKVTEIEHRKTRETRADAPESGAEESATAAETPPGAENGIRVAVESEDPASSDPAADAQDPQGAGTGRSESGQGGVGAARRGDDVPPPRNDPDRSNDEAAGASSRSEPSNPPQGRRSGTDTDASVGPDVEQNGRRSNGAEPPQSGSDGGLGTDGHRDATQNGDGRRGSVEASSDGGRSDRAGGTSNTGFSGSDTGTGVKPRPDEEGSYDYACPECDGPVSGQPEMCIHCGTSFRWT